MDTRCENCNTCVACEWTQTDDAIIRRARWLRTVSKEKLNVKAHSNSANSATIVISGTDGLRNDADIATVATTADAQSLATAVKRLDAHHRIQHHIQWRSVAAADLLKYAIVDTLVRRLDAHEAFTERTCTANVYATAGAVGQQPAISAEELQSQSQQHQ